MVSADGETQEKVLVGVAAEADHDCKLNDWACMDVLEIHASEEEEDEEEEEVVVVEEEVEDEEEEEGAYFSSATSFLRSEAVSERR